MKNKEQINGHLKEEDILDYILKKRKLNNDEEEAIVKHLADCEFCRMRSVSLRNSFSIPEQYARKNSDAVQRLIQKHKIEADIEEKDVPVTDDENRFKKWISSIFHNPLRTGLVFGGGLAVLLLILGLWVYQPTLTMMSRPGSTERKMIEVALDWNDVTNLENYMTSSSNDTTDFMGDQSIVSMNSTFDIPAEEFILLKKYQSNQKIDALKEFFHRNGFDQLSTRLDQIETPKVEVKIDPYFLNKIISDQNFRPKIKIKIGADFSIEISEY